jgi:hypothetical protein
LLIENRPLAIAMMKSIGAGRLKISVMHPVLVTQPCQARKPYLQGP